MTDEKYKRVQLGDNGDWVWESVDQKGLYICSICYANGESDIPLQRTGARAVSVFAEGFEQYQCRRCKAMYTTHPR